jgi:hypothetical protein
MREQFRVTRLQSHAADDAASESYTPQDVRNVRSWWNDALPDYDGLIDALVSPEGDRGDGVE